MLEDEAHRLDAFRVAEPRPPRRGPLNTLRAKVIVVILLAVAVPMTVSAAFVHQSYTNSAERAAQQSALELTNAVAAGFDGFVDNLEGYTMLPVADRRVLSILQGHVDPTTRTPLTNSERDLLRSAFMPAQLDSDDVQDLRLITLDGWQYRLQSDPNTFALVSENSREWIQIAYAADGALVFVQPDGLSSVDRLGLARLVREPLTHRPMGYVMVEVALADVRRFAPENVQGVIELVDRHERVFFSSGTTASESALTVSARAPSGRFYTNVTIPTSALTSDATALSQGWLLVGGISLVLACAGAAVLVRRMMRPVEELRDTMRLVASGKTTSRAPVRTNDEIGLLSVSLNRMLDQIDELVTDLREMAGRERDAVVRALQGQMNPHFIFNSLEIVNMQAVQREDWELSDAITRVGRLLRYMVDLSSTEIRLAEELGFVSNWVDVYSANREAAVTLEIAVAAEHLSMEIPKFVLQPLVENAMLHSPADAPRVVRISSDMRGDRLIVTVANPMSAPALTQQVDHLRTRLRAREPSPSTVPGGAGGHGLVNVHHRLRLLHGAGAGLELVTRGGQFVVELHLPQRPADDVAEVPQEIQRP